MELKDMGLEELRRAVLNDPRNAELRFLLGAEMAQQRDYDGAVLELSAAVALNPLLHVARFQLGLLHLTLGQPHHTVAVLGPLESLDDAAALKYFKRGLEALIADDFETCLRNLKHGMEINQDNAPLNRDMALIVERVTSAVGTASTQTPLSGTDPNAENSDAVRTDFSLYGQTRH